MDNNLSGLMKPRLVILVESYFQERDYQRFGISILQANGLAVEVWEVFRSWRRKYAVSYRPPDPAIFTGLRHFFKTTDVIRELQALRPQDTVLVVMSERWETYAIYRQLARQNAYYGSILISAVNPLSTPRQFRLRDWRIWRERVYVRLPRWVKKTSLPGFILLCGGNALESALTRLPHTRAIWSHALDYDIALELGAVASKRVGKHIVFLDEFVPFHPDYLTHGFTAPNTAAEYYPKLNQLFGGLEELLGVPVVIAAHPRANYADAPKYFEKRRVIQGQTGALVRDATLVVTHSSVSNAFTAIYRKPLLVVTTNGLDKSYYGPFIQATADAFGTRMINLDADDRRPFDSSILKVDEILHSKFMERFVKRTGTSDQNTWQILADHLKNR